MAGAPPICGLRLGGGGAAGVQRNIITELVLGMAHDVVVQSGQTWTEARVGVSVL
jgi:hypothetical protein